MEGQSNSTAQTSPGLQSRRKAARREQAKVVLACLLGALADNAAYSQSTDNRGRQNETANIAKTALDIAPNRDTKRSPPAALDHRDALELYHQDLAFRMLLAGSTPEDVRRALDADQSAPEIWQDAEFYARRKGYLQNLARGGTSLLIIGGRPSCEPNETDFLDVIKLYQAPETGTGIVICDGAVLTAKHCVPDPNAKTIVTLNCAGTATTAATKIIHYQPGLDLALVLVDPAAIKRSRICAWATTADLTSATEVCCVGFGATDDGAGGRDGTRRVGQGMTVASSDCYCTTPESRPPGCIRCLELVSASGIKRADGKMIDICKGESGGAMFVMVAGAYLLGGITRDNREGQVAGALCGSGGIFVRLDNPQVRTWIKDTLTANGRHCDIPAP